MSPTSKSRLSVGSLNSSEEPKVVFKKRDKNVISTGDKADLKRKRGREEEEHGGKEGLEELCKRLCPKPVEVLVEPIRFKEIMITTPSKGHREVYYVSIASDSEDSSDEDEDEEEDKPEDKEKIRYEDWRVQTIQAFPSSTPPGNKKANQEKENNDIVFFQIPSTHDFIFNVAYAKDDLHSVMDILGGKSMSTPVIDGYLMLRLQKYFNDFNATLHKRKKPSPSYKLRHEKSLATPAPPPPKPLNFHYLSVNFMMVKDRDQPLDSFKPLLRFLPDLQNLPENSDALLLAPLYASKHLYLAVFNFQEKTVNAYDSSWHYLPMPLRQRQIQVILEQVTKHHLNSDASQWTVNFVETSCPQFDEYSCGIYTIHYADLVMRGIAHQKSRWLLSNKRVMQIRRHIVKSLLNTTQYGRRFLEAISN